MGGQGGVRMNESVVDWGKELGWDVREWSYRVGR